MGSQRVTGLSIHIPPSFSFLSQLVLQAFRFLWKPSGPFTAPSFLLPVKLLTCGLPLHKHGSRVHRDFPLLTCGALRTDFLGWINTLMKSRRERVLATLCGHSRRVAICTPGREVSAGTASALTLDFPACGSVRSQFFIA